MRRRAARSAENETSHRAAPRAPRLAPDPFGGATEIVREVCETVDFHGGRPWAVEVAVWDLVGKALGAPLWQLLGGRSESLIAYASSGELVSPQERAERCLREATRRVVQLRDPPAYLRVARRALERPDIEPTRTNEIAVGTRIITPRGRGRFIRAASRVFRCSGMSIC